MSIYKVITEKETHHINADYIHIKDVIHLFKHGDVLVAIFPLGTTVIDASYLYGEDITSYEEKKTNMEQLLIMMREMVSLMKEIKSME